MSVGKQVSDAIDKMGAADYEGALFAICAAIEATAKRELGKGGRKSYKDFIQANFGLIADVGVGRRVLNLNLQFDHPELKKSVDGTHSVQDILYHVVRCGLYHEAGIPNELKFTNEHKIYYQGGALILPATLI